MRYLLLFVLALNLGACQNNTSNYLIQENATLQLKVNLAEQTAINAEAVARLAREEAEQSFENAKEAARIANEAKTEWDRIKVELEKCKSGK